MRLITHFTVGVAFVLYATGCEKKVIPPEVPQLQKLEGKAQTRLSEIDAEMKTVQDDPIASAALNEEKELLKSRIERIKENLIRNGAGEPAGEGAPAAHH